MFKWNRIGLALSLLLTLGAGCSVDSLPDLSSLPKLPAFSIASWLTKDFLAINLNLKPGSTIKIVNTSLAPISLGGGKIERELFVQEWLVSDWVKLTWSESEQQETAESIAARQAANNGGVGETESVPEPIYETISRTGELTTDALDDGERILLPSAWPEGQMNLTGSNNTLFWLSKTQYHELVSTRQTNLELTSIDAEMNKVLNLADNFKDLIIKFQGGDTGLDNENLADSLTRVEAEPNWGSYILKFNDKKVEVATVEAENKLASFTILANPDNPIILEVNLKPWAYGTEALGVLNQKLKVTGYKVTSITTPE